MWVRMLRHPVIIAGIIAMLLGILCIGSKSTALKMLGCLMVVGGACAFLYYVVWFLV